jgi:transcription elongation factor Elf1
VKEHDDEKAEQESFGIQNRLGNYRRSFQCPKCGKSISPDDESEENYQILDTKVVNDELAELVISCANCGSTIKLTGFQQSSDV